jgi:hypothetical protein
MSENKANFSSLNNGVIPDDKFLDELEIYTPRLSEEIIKSICENKGLNTADPRVYNEFI